MSRSNRSKKRRLLVGSEPPWPFRPEQWREIQETADALETLRGSRGLPLTMGGEPTFVAVGRDDPEWSVEAMGATKLEFARRMAADLARSFMTAPLVTLNFGKRYPGEPLPRWNLVLQTRPGRELWPDTDRFLMSASETRAVAKQLAGRIAGAIAGALGLSEGLTRIPDVEGRVGAWVLPLDFRGDSWVTDRWPCRDRGKRMMPGDSPAGLRLPLNELGPDAMRSALTVQWVAGAIEVFMPPLALEAHDALIAVVERATAGLPPGSLVLAGYLPGGLHPCSKLVLSADPGVLEVNLPPCANWREFGAWLAAVDASARRVGLVPEKFHYNGDATGTGGGCHLTFGSLQPRNSPFLTRPRLIPAVIRYWHNNPALSYLFSGRFLGAGCQAPRFDESRPELCGELELALAMADDVRMTREDRARQFQDFFVDAAGNPHRSELCFDKLWNPGVPGGRLGLIEFRAFETFPGWRMVALMALLVRALMVYLAADPSGAKLTAWRESLHDQFFLPQFLRRNLNKILADLRKSGVRFRSEWFEPFFEIRFPLLGRLPIGTGGGAGAELEIRQALEAWPLLSEQARNSTTSRPVDSSNLRIEISCGDAEAVRLGALRVNGVPVSLRRCGGRFIRGLRFRSVQFPDGFHPKLAAQTPLLFEWIRRSDRRVAAAARWYPWHPEGQAYSARPESQAEADERVRDRWRPVSPGRVHGIPGPDVELDDDQDAWTFDLRQPRSVRRRK